MALIRVLTSTKGDQITLNVWLNRFTFNIVIKPRLYLAVYPTSATMLLLYHDKLIFQITRVNTCIIPLISAWYNVISIVAGYALVCVSAIAILIA